MYASTKTPRKYQKRITAYKHPPINSQPSTSTHKHRRHRTHHHPAQSHGSNSFNYSHAPHNISLNATFTFSGTSTKGSSLVVSQRQHVSTNKSIKGPHPNISRTVIFRSFPVRAFGGFSRPRDRLRESSPRSWNKSNYCAKIGTVWICNYKETVEGGLINNTGSPFVDAQDGRFI